MWHTTSHMKRKIREPKLYVSHQNQGKDGDQQSGISRGKAKADGHGGVLSNH